MPHEQDRLGASSQSEDRAATASQPSQSSVVSGVAGIPCAFTPGPWSAPDFPEGSEFEVHDREGAYICGVPFDTAGPTPADALADARLIAAAPELYEALQRLASISAGDKTDQDTPLQAAYRALAKARGQ